VNSNIAASQVAAEEDAIRLWDVATTKEIRRLPDDGGNPLSVPLWQRLVFSADGKTLLAGGHLHSIHAWDVVSGKDRFGPLQGHRDAVTSLAISSDGRLLVSGSHDATVVVWDLTAILKAN